MRWNCRRFSQLKKGGMNLFMPRNTRSIGACRIEATYTRLCLAINFTHDHVERAYNGGNVGD